MLLFSHLLIRNLHLWVRSLFQMTADDVVFLASPLTFDPSVVDMFLALSSGAQLLVVPSVLKQTPGRLARRLFQRHKTTVMQVEEGEWPFRRTPLRSATFTALVSTGHPDAAHTLRATHLEAGSAVVCLPPAGPGSGGRGLPSPGPAAELEAGAQPNERLQHLRDNGGVLLGLLSQDTGVAAAVTRAVSVCLNRCVQTSWGQPGVLRRVLSPSAESFVPLGAPLMDTRVEVRDDEGGLVTEGEGQVFIGETLTLTHTY